ncbi:NBR1-Ig-like domain-containing protein [Paraburkholderia kururiensis]|uniref:NBR1-Ig-like domain-containing protein n=1 Tax=Paraburkholderia kururiensis TaxID=984307 RepID=A0ABZ0WJ48_9BURK|nr:NBR1-Ig-like domain-containing protein [Paraburkholderia kururiensis]WQD77379.1 NBR1-Ig-like domain-containing protein [Paraburkholderia kururiensis]
MASKVSFLANNPPSCTLLQEKHVRQKQETLRALIARRGRELGKSMTAIARQAGLSRTYLYGLAGGAAQDPSVRTLVKLAKAIEVSPLLLFRYYADLGGAPTKGAPVAPTNRATGVHDPQDVAVFNADVTTPDHAVVLPGEVFQKVWEIQNVGKRLWSGRRLVRVDGEYVMARRTPHKTELEIVLDAHLSSLHREIAIPDTHPGQPVRLAVDFAAPRESCTVASIWRIEDSDGQPCYGPSFILHVVVTVMAR